VVAVYLLSDSSIWEGEQMPEWLAAEDFHRHAGWSLAFIQSFEPPKNSPERFKLIRLAFGLSQRYRKSSANVYGWRLRFRSFEDHLAYLFAHELHHFRRYHLGMHDGEGEQSACRWAVQRSKESGFQVEGARIRCRKRRKANRTDIRVPLKRNCRLL